MRLRSGKEPKKRRETKNLQNLGRKEGSNLAQQLKKVKPVQSLKKVSNQKEFDNVYKDLLQPGAYTNKIVKYLQKNNVHSLHKGVRKKFLRRKIITHYPGHITQSDLIDMQKFSGSNSGYNYILVFIDCFSKKLWLEPLKTKSGRDTSEALRRIINKIDFPIQSLIFDEGLEYRNKFVLNLLAEYNIHHYHIKTQHKASTAERVNRTIKGMIWKIFTETGRKKWVDKLIEICENYNNTYHSSIKMAPNDVTWKNFKKVFKALYPKIHSVVNCRLKRGDKVRVALNKDLFEKSYTVNWSKDFFTISHIFQKNGVCWYRLLDEKGNIYPKSKYFYQLNKVE